MAGTGADLAGWLGALGTGCCAFASWREEWQPLCPQTKHPIAGGAWETPLLVHGSLSGNLVVNRHNIHDDEMVVC